VKKLPGGSALVKLDEKLILKPLAKLETWINNHKKFLTILVLIVGIVCLGVMAYYAWTAATASAAASATTAAAASTAAAGSGVVASAAVPATLATTGETIAGLSVVTGGGATVEVVASTVIIPTVSEMALTSAGMAAVALANPGIPSTSTTMPDGSKNVMPTDSAGQKAALQKGWQYTLKKQAAGLLTSAAVAEAKKLFMGQAAASGVAGVFSQADLDALTAAGMVDPNAGAYYGPDSEFTQVPTWLLPAAAGLFVAIAASK